MILKKQSILIILILIITLLLTTTTLAQGKVYQTKLLAVHEEADNYVGSDADLFLEIREGSGRIFLETIPLTKIDTQISTRFAKEVACSHFNLDCENYDFIYTIKAKSNIIGGPSAGASLAALTTIAVLDLDYDKNVVVTGTINSGGIIGPVGGVKEKIQAAAKAGIKKALIPKWTNLESTHSNQQETNKTNQIITTNKSSTNSNQTNINQDQIKQISSQENNFTKFAKKNPSIKVVEVTTIDQVVFEMTGINLNDKEYEIKEDKQYTKIMQELKTGLCQRNQKIREDLKDQNVNLNRTQRDYFNNKFEVAQNASKTGDFYSAASYCFSSNIELRQFFYEKKQPNIQIIKGLFSKLQKDKDKLQLEVNNQKIQTISDLQTLMVVKERLNDVQTQINKFNQSIDIGENTSNIFTPEMLNGYYSLLAYSQERFYSAKSWKEFFKMDGKKFNLNENKLDELCLNKLLEAQERIEYGNIFVGSFMNNIKDKATIARKAYDKNQSALCLITATQAKADANALLSTLGVNNETLSELISTKKSAVERVIAQNSEEKIFPILGYSYYKYANSLAQDQKYTSLVYLEYALEMSDLAIYFPKDRTIQRTKDFLTRDRLIFMEGFMFGILICLLIYISTKKSSKNRIRKHKKKLI
jgi:uncharacterized protein